MRKCKIFVHDVEAGELVESDNGEYIFTYCNGYSDAPVSPTMPVRVEPYRSAFLFPVFFNMLSEGANRQIQSQLLHIDENDDVGIMMATARFDTIGAITVKPVSE